MLACWPRKIFHGQMENESNKGDFNEALEHNLEGKTSEKDRVSPEKKNTLLVVLADLRKNQQSTISFQKPLICIN